MSLTARRGEALLPTPLETSSSPSRAGTGSGQVGPAAFSPSQYRRQLGQLKLARSGEVTAKISGLQERGSSHTALPLSVSCCIHLL